MGKPTDSRTNTAREEEPKWLTERELSKMLSISLSKLRQDRLRHRGLPYYKLGKAVRYNLSDVEIYMAARRIEPDGHWWPSPVSKSSVARYSPVRASTMSVEIGEAGNLLTFT